MILTQFITDNNLTFEVGRRNADATIVCGYGLYLGKDLEEIKEEVKNAVPSIDGEVEDEIDFVFPYAKRNNYGVWWEKESNRNQYKNA